MSHQDSASHRHHLIGIGLILLGFFCASCISAFGKVLVDQMSLGLLLFSQNAIAFCLALLFSLASLKRKITTKVVKWHIFRTLAGLASYLCFFIAVASLPLVNATLLANSAPLFLPLVAWVWLGQKISKGLWISLFIGFAGVFFMVNPTAQISKLFESWLVLVALSGSLFSAIALQCVRHLNKTEKTITINLYYFGLASLLTLPWALTGSISFDNVNIWCVFGIGISLFLTQQLLSAAYRYASPTLLAPFNYSIVVFTGIIGWIFWGTLPTILSGVGLLLISLGGILSIKQINKKA